VAGVPKAKFCCIGNQYSNSVNLQLEFSFLFRSCLSVSVKFKKISGSVFKSSGSLFRRSGGKWCVDVGRVGGVVDFKKKKSGLLMGRGVVGGFRGGCEKKSGCRVNSSNLCTVISEGGFDVSKKLGSILKLNFKYFLLIPLNYN